jgi:hypothetical protein
VLSRSFVIAMKKAEPQIRLPKDLSADPVIVGVRALIEDWASRVKLVLNPELPLALCRDPRSQDKCRPLIAIADSLDRGEEARAALVEVCADLLPADIGLMAFEGCRTVWLSKAAHLFTLGAFDRITKKAMVAGLIEANPYWAAWRGPRDKGQPHELTRAELSRLLRAFGITTKNVWPVPRKPGDKSAEGWFLAQFEQPWREHCAEGPTSPQPSKIIRLQPHKNRTKS